MLFQLGSVQSIWLFGSVSLLVSMDWYYARQKNKQDEIALKAYLKSLESKGACDVKQN